MTDDNKIRLQLALDIEEFTVLDALKIPAKYCFDALLYVFLLSAGGHLPNTGTTCPMSMPVKFQPNQLTKLTKKSDFVKKKSDHSLSLSS